MKMDGAEATGLVRLARSAVIGWKIDTGVSHLSKTVSNGWTLWEGTIT